jgi:transposase
MKASRQYLRFCGIDIAKRKHVACIVEKDGQYLLRPKSFHNDALGYQRILNCLKQTARTKSILTGMEATGHYWYSLHDFLIRQGYTVAVLNPIQTAQQAKQAIRKCKTDKHDAFHIATLLRTAQYKAALVPGELAMTCRQLTRLRYRIVRQGALIKQLLNSRLYPAWPEYETFFADKFGPTSRKLLHAATCPQELLMLEPQSLTELIHKASRGKLGPELAQRIRQTAHDSIGVQRGQYGRSTCIRVLLEHIEALSPIRKKLEAEIEALANQLPGYLSTLPGATQLTIVSLYGEVDPIEVFTSPSQLVAFTGLDPKVFQTGQYDARRRHVSKRGSPYLRRTLWQMAHRAVCQEGELRDYWRKKRRQNKHHLVAVTATANKLCRIVWRIMTDRRDYIPRQSNPNS